MYIICNYIFSQIDMSHVNCHRMNPRKWKRERKTVLMVVYTSYLSMSNQR